MMQRDLTKLGPCSRCKEGLLREKIPILQLIQIFGATTKSLMGAVQGINMGHASKFPVMIAQNFWPTDIEFEPPDEEANFGTIKKEYILCLRCSADLLGFLDGGEVVFKEEDDDNGI